jgi:glycerol uptake facilitator-like aquaporin
VSRWTHLIARAYRLLLAFYPSAFRAEFGDEMQDVFADILAGVKTRNWSHSIILLARELRDLPGSAWREHLRARKRMPMSQNPTWRPPTTKELLAGLTLFVFPILPAILTLMFGYQPLINQIRSKITIALLVIVLVAIVLGLKHGFPRWTVPYLGVVVASVVLLEPSWRIWHFFYSDVQRAIGYFSQTLQVRVLYHALMWGFFWFLVFASFILLILLLMAWPRTRQLARRIRLDWTLFSFMLFGGLVFQLEIIFDEYAYDEPWRIACRVCLALGAWFYFKNTDPRKRILALLAAVTLYYWIAAVGKWYLVPLQSWRPRIYETYRRFEFWGTLAEWGWVMLFMLIPALLPRIRRSEIADSPSEEDLIPA